jgi:hypothetical protein
MTTSSPPISPYHLYSSWLFNPDLKIPVPKELLTYNSPITIPYAINMFIMNAKLNLFLDQNLNTLEAYYLEKEEVFNFLKKCVKDFKIHKKDIPFIPRQKNEKIYEELRKKIAVLKNYEISLLADIINKSENKDKIYVSLGLSKIEKPKKIKKIDKKNKGIAIKEYIKKNYVVTKDDKSIVTT